MDYSSVCIPVRVSWSLTVAGSDIYDLIRTEFASFLKLNYQFDKMPLQRDAAVRGNVSFKFLRWNGNFAAVSSISQREAGAFFVPLRLIWICPGLQMGNRREGSSGCLSMRERYAIPILALICLKFKMQSKSTGDMCRFVPHSWSCSPSWEAPS